MFDDQVLFTSLALNEDFFLCVPTIGTLDKIGVRIVLLNSVCTIVNGIT